MLCCVNPLMYLQPLSWSRLQFKEEGRLSASCNRVNKGTVVVSFLLLSGNCFLAYKDVIVYTLALLGRLISTSEPAAAIIIHPQTEIILQTLRQLNSEKHSLVILNINVYFFSFPNFVN